MLLNWFKHFVIYHVLSMQGFWFNASYVLFTKGGISLMTLLKSI